MKKEVLKAFIQKVWNEGNIDAIPEFIADKYTIIHDPGDLWDGMELDIVGFQHRASTSRAPVTVGKPSGLTRDILMTVSWAINIVVAELIINRYVTQRPSKAIQADLCATSHL